MSYVPDAKRYDGAQFRQCGRSGIVLPPVSLGLWQNFGGVDSFENGRAMVRRAFDRGVTHFDLANNYGPPYGSAEENFGHILRKDFRDHRNELLISSKAGWDMWLGPYGVGGYSSPAVKEASGPKGLLLLFDHNHLYMLLHGGCSLEEMICRVRRHASQTGEAYLGPRGFNE